MRGKETALFILIITMLFSAGCGGGSAAVRETAVPTETAEPTTAAVTAVPAAEIPPAASVLELPDFTMAGLVPDADSSGDAGNFCIADETAAAEQDCGPGEDPLTADETLSADLSGMDEEQLPDYTMPDLDGTEMRLGDMLAGNQLTILNIWGIGCGPCMTEMPELAAIRREFRGQGLEIIGLAADLLDGSGRIDPALVKEAKGIVTDLGVDYPILAMSREVRDQMGIFATPTTYLVDSSGQVIGDVIMGTRPAGEWERIIMEALQKTS